MSKKMIVAERLSKYYGDFIAVNDISFSLSKGEIVAFLGPNGAGKSTTMKMLTGTIAPSKGSAKIAGFDVYKEQQEMSKHLGYLPENGPLYDDMTPLESFQFFAEARGMNKEKQKLEIERVINLLSLKEVADKPIDKLSRGFRQRVGLAQALLHDPEVIIMDEPTLGLDPNQLKTFRATIKELGKDKTILLSTHILQEVEALADRVILINNGKLLFDGTLHQLKEGYNSIEEAFYSLTNNIERGKND